MIYATFQHGDNVGKNQLVYYLIFDVMIGYNIWLLMFTTFLIALKKIHMLELKPFQSNNCCAIRAIVVKLKIVWYARISTIDQNFYKKYIAGKCSFHISN